MIGPMKGAVDNPPEVLANKYNDKAPWLSKSLLPSSSTGLKSSIGGMGSRYRAKGAFHPSALATIAGSDALSNQTSQNSEHATLKLKLNAFKPNMTTITPPSKVLAATANDVRPPIFARPLTPDSEDDVNHVDLNEDEDEYADNEEEVQFHPPLFARLKPLGEEILMFLNLDIDYEGSAHDEDNNPLIHSLLRNPSKYLPANGVPQPSTPPHLFMRNPPTLTQESLNSLPRLLASKLKPGFNKGVFRCAVSACPRIHSGGIVMSVLKDEIGECIVVFSRCHTSLDLKRRRWIEIYNPLLTHGKKSRHKCIVVTDFETLRPMRESVAIPLEKAEKKAADGFDFIKRGFYRQSVSPLLDALRFHTNDGILHTALLNLATIHAARGHLKDSLLFLMAAEHVLTTTESS
ncbi:hypothetical protein HDV05_006726, partial [Chytridiales sp. JEL 0842]